MNAQTQAEQAEQAVIEKVIQEWADLAFKAACGMVQAKQELNDRRAAAVGGVGGGAA